MAKLKTISADEIILQRFLNVKFPFRFVDSDRGCLEHNKTDNADDPVDVAMYLLKDNANFSVTYLSSQPSYALCLSLSLYLSLSLSLALRAHQSVARASADTETFP